LFLQPICARTIHRLIFYALLPSSHFRANAAYIAWVAALALLLLTFMLAMQLILLPPATTAASSSSSLPSSASPLLTALSRRQLPIFLAAK
jgi:hypothetical protein